VLTKNSFTEDSERQVGTGTALTKNSFTEDKLNGYRYLVPEAPGETDVVGGRVVEGGQVVLL
jgi:hypothetical protein